MYFTLYNKVFDDIVDKNQNKSVDKINQQYHDIDICIICWCSETNINEIKPLKEFKNISKKCHCNPRIHNECLEDWTKKHLSCPICRKNMSFIKCYGFSIVDFNIICIKYTICFFRFISFSLSAISLCLILTIHYICK